MPSRSSRSASEEPAKETDAPEASASQPESSASATPNQVDDSGWNDNASKDDNHEDREKTTNDKTDTDTSVSVEVPTTDNHMPTSSQGDWQAIWAPAQQAYYFYNAHTQETTWRNPLHPPSPTDAVAEAATAGGSSTSHPAATPTTMYNATYAAQVAAEAAGIDPSLAYLDPSLGLPGSAPSGTFTAKFNARTGAFTRPDARDPSHLSEAERAKRMSQVYFDVGAWEKEVEARKEEEAAEGNGKKRKRPTKKDLERFKEQKKQKKIAKTAWLRT